MKLIKNYQLSWLLTLAVPVQCFLFILSLPFLGPGSINNCARENCFILNNKPADGPSILLLFYDGSAFYAQRKSGIYVSMYRLPRRLAYTRCFCFSSCYAPRNNYILTFSAFNAIIPIRVCRGFRFGFLRMVSALKLWYFVDLAKFHSDDNQISSKVDPDEAIWRLKQQSKHTKWILCAVFYGHIYCPVRSKSEEYGGL